MSTAKTLTVEEITELKKKNIDFSDILEITDEQAKELYPKNWKPRKLAVSARIDMDTLEWLKEPGGKDVL